MRSKPRSIYLSSTVLGSGSLLESHIETLSTQIYLAVQYIYSTVDRSSVGVGFVPDRRSASQPGTALRTNFSPHMLLIQAPQMSLI